MFIIWHQSSLKIGPAENIFANSSITWEIVLCLYDQIMPTECSSNHLMLESQSIIKRIKSDTSLTP